MGLLYKRVQHNNLFPNLSAIESTTYSFFCSSSQFKKAISHRLRQLVGKVTPHDFHSLKQRKSSSSNPIWKSFYQQPYIFVKKLNDIVCRRIRLNLTDCRCGSWLFCLCRPFGTHETPVESNRKNYSKKAIISAILMLFCTCNALALDTPTVSKLDRRLYKTVYEENQVYPIYAVNGLVTSIVFAEDEKVDVHTSGFSTAWEFAARGNHFFLKPRAKEGSTNLVVVTNKRTYHFDLRLGWNRKTATYELAFTYPEEEAAKRAAAREKERVEARLKTSATKPASAAEAPASNRNYTMNFGEAKSSRSLAPVEAFDDGRFTYLRFGKSSDFPSVYRVVDETETLLNAHVEGDWLVVHGIYEALRLRAGQAVVGLYNESYTGGGADTEDGVSVPGLRRVSVGGQ